MSKCPFNFYNCYSSFNLILSNAFDDLDNIDLIKEELKQKLSNFSFSKKDLSYDPREHLKKAIEKWVVDKKSILEAFGSTLEQLNKISDIENNLTGFVDYIAGIQSPNIQPEKINEVQLVPTLDLSYVEQFTAITLNNAYHSAIKAKSLMQRLFRLSVIGALFIDFKNGIFIHNNLQANENILKALNNFVEILKSYAKEKGINTDGIDLYINTKNGLKLATGGWFKIQKLAEDLFKNITDAQLNDWFRDRNDNVVSAKALNAYNAWIMLNNFDMLIKKLLGKTIDISESYSGIYQQIADEASKEKYIINFESNLIKTWRDNDEVNALEELGSITNILIESTPIYNYKTKQRMSDYVLSVSDFADAFMLLKQCNDYKIQQTLIKFMENPLATINELINLGLNYEFSDSSKTSSDRIKNILYSVQQHFFRIEYIPGEDYSLFNIILKEPQYLTKIVNYLNYIICAIDKTVPIEHSEYRLNREGKFETKFLSKSFYEKRKFIIQNSITNMANILPEQLVKDLVGDAEGNLGKYTVTVDPNMKVNWTIEYTFKGNKVTIGFVNDKDNYKIKSLKVDTPDGHIASEKEVDDILIELIDDTLNQNLRKDSDVIEMLKLVYVRALKRPKAGELKETALINVASLGIRVLIKHKLDIDGISGTSAVDYYNYTKDDAEKITDQKTGKIAPLTYDTKTNGIIDKLAVAQSIAKNENAKSTSKNAEGNSVANYGLTNLVSTINKVIYDGKVGENSATKHSMFCQNNLILGITVKSGAKGIDNITVKSENDFNVSEHAYSSIMLDFLQPLVNGGNFYITPTVFSDRNLSHMINIDGNKIVNTGTVNKKLNDLTGQEMYDYHFNTMLKAYGLLKKNIEADYQKTILYLANSYPDVNKYLKDANKEIKDITYEWVRDVFFPYLNTKFINGGAVEIFKASAKYSGANLVLDVHFTPVIKNNTSILGTNRVLNFYFLMYNDKSIYNRYLNNNRNRFILNLINYNVRLPYNSDVKAFVELYKIQNFSSWVDALNNLILFKRIDDNLIINPVVDKYLAFDSVLSSLLMFSTVGGCFVHKDNFGGEFDDDDEFLKAEQEEAGRALTLYKRMVIFAASIHNFGQSYLNGVPSYYNMATIEDIKAPTFNFINGDSKKSLTSLDGAGYCPAWVALWQNGSLGDAAGSFDFKPIGHSTVHDYGTAVLLKLAIYSFTNEKIRMSRPDLKEEDDAQVSLKTMLYKMASLQWDYPVDLSKKWLTDIYDDPSIEINTDLSEINKSGIFYMDNSDKSNIKHYRILGLSHKEGYTHIISKALVDENGNFINSLGVRVLQPIIENEERYIDSNYALWEAFGAELSEHLVDGKLEFGEDSNIAVAYFGNECGIVRYKEQENIVRQDLIRNPNNIKSKGALASSVLTLDDVYLPLKYSGISYLINQSASKDAHINLNEKDQWHRNDGIADDLWYYKMPTLNIGYQIDADHKADNSSLTEMSLVIAALEENGITHNIAKAAYLDLGLIIHQTLSQEIDAMQSYYDTGDSNKIYEIVGKAFIKAFENTGGNRANLTDSIIYNLLEELSLDKELSELPIFIPFSDNNVLGAALSTITSNINRSAIKRKYAGIGAILIPSYHFFKIFTIEENNYDKDGNNIGKKNVDYTYSSILRKGIDLEKIQAEYESDEDNQILSNRLILGKTYIKITKDIDGNITSRLRVILDTLAKYNKEREDANGIYYEDKTSGRELQPANGTFYTIDNNRNSITYNLYDLDSVKFKIGFSEVLLGKSFDEIKSYVNTNIIPKILDIEETHSNENLYVLNNYRLLVKAKIIKYLNQAEECYKKGDTWQGNKNLGFINLELLHLMEREFKFLDDNELKFIFINNQVIRCYKYELTPAELIMSKTYKTIFGLKEGVNLNDVNLDFFREQIKENYKVPDQAKHYDLVLKRNNGQHIYIILDKKNVPLHATKVNVAKLFDPDSNGMVRVNSDNTLSPFNNAELYVKDNIEFIVTLDILQFVDYYNDFIGIELNDTVDENSNKTEKERLYTAWLYLLSLENTKLNRPYTEIRNEYRSIEQNNINYTELITKIREKIKNLEDSIIETAANEKYTSFLKSLDFIAARIPAQAMLSFMAMKVVAFSDSDENRAYVSHFQTFLQGSDYDIDKVYLLGSEFTKSGKYIGWSPLFDYSSIEALKESENLPMPNGRDTSFISDTYNHSEIDKLLLDILDTLLINSDIDLDIIPDNIYYIKAMTRLLHYINNNDLTNVHYNLEHIVESLQNEYGVVAREGQDLTLKVKLYIEDINLEVNLHNNYFKTIKNRDILIKMTKNSVSSKLHKTASSSGNLVAGYTPIELDIPLSAAKQSPLGKAEKEFTLFDSSTKWIMRNLNMVGTKSIGITAVGLKVLFALLYYFNELARTKDPTKTRRALFHHEFNFIKDGKLLVVIKNLISNINFDNIDAPKEWRDQIQKNLLYLLNNYSDSPYYQYMLDLCLMQIGVTADTSVINSLLISAATDNAKELILSKINATPDFLKVYTYAIILGIDFDLMAELMTSPTVTTISKLSLKNLFLDWNSGSSINAVESYIEQGLDYFNYNFSKGGGINAGIAPSTLLQELDWENTFNEIKKQYNDGFYEEANTLFLDLKTKSEELLRSLKFDTANSEEARFLNDFNNLLDTIKSINLLHYFLFKLLFELSEEFRIYGLILSLNQGIATDLAGKLDFFHSIESYVNKRMLHYSPSFKKLVASQGKSKYDSFSLIVDKIHKEKPWYTEEEIINILSEATRRNMLTDFSFLSFLLSEGYRKVAIDFYDLIKGTINLFDNIDVTPHFKAMADACGLDFLLGLNVSLRVARTYYLTKHIFKRMKGLTKNERVQVFRSISNFLQIEIITKYFADRDIIIPISENVKTYNGYGKLDDFKDGFIDLGTLHGQASFKYWMENYVIPRVQKGYTMDDNDTVDSNLLTNLFILDLKLNSTDRTLTNGTRRIYTLPIDMSSTEEDTVYDDYLLSFNKLAGITYNGVNLLLLLFYYNLITYHDLYGEHALTKIFSTAIQQNKGNNPLNDYFIYVGELDKKKLLIGSFIDEDEVLLNCAPRLKRSEGIKGKLKSDYVLVWDNKSRQSKIYKYQKQWSYDDADQFYDYYDDYLGESYTYQPKDYTLLNFIQDVDAQGVIHDFPRLTLSMFGENLIISETLTDRVLRLYNQRKILILNNCE